MNIGSYIKVTSCPRQRKFYFDVPINYAKTINMVRKTASQDCGAKDLMKK